MRYGITYYTTNLTEITSEQDTKWILITSLPITYTASQFTEPHTQKQFLEVPNAEGRHW